MRRQKSASILIFLVIFTSAQTFVPKDMINKNTRSLFKYESRGSKGIWYKIYQKIQEDSVLIFHVKADKRPLETILDSLVKLDYTDKVITKKIKDVKVFLKEISRRFYSMDTTYNKLGIYIDSVFALDIQINLISKANKIDKYFLQTYYTSLSKDSINKCLSNNKDYSLIHYKQIDLYFFSCYFDAYFRDKPGNYKNFIFRRGFWKYF